MKDIKSILKKIIILNININRLFFCKSIMKKKTNKTNIKPAATNWDCCCHNYSASLIAQESEEIWKNAKASEVK